jgi:hypothetical protein
MKKLLPISCETTLPIRGRIKIICRSSGFSVIIPQKRKG